MRTIHTIFALILALAAGHAYSACSTMRLGYIDQHRPPYYIGSGVVEPDRPGASVELLRAIAASAGCEVVTVRLPLLRLRAALEAGTIDAMPLDATEDDGDRFALPKNKSGKLDRDKALRFNTVVFVRASDKLDKDLDPAVYFKSRVLGFNHGATMAAQLRALGYQVDDGALESNANIEKLLRNRFDGYGVSLVSASDMDKVMAAAYGERVVRMDKPLRVNNIWLALSKAYYEKNPKPAEAMWTWTGTQGHVRFAELVKKYENER
jgi:ABC-type amino acid transport substrate-binding protein